MILFITLHLRCNTTLLTAAFVAAHLFLFSPEASRSQAGSAKQELPVVEGKICDASGAPVRGAELQLESENGNSQNELVVAKTTADAAGNYALAAPRAGLYVLQASADGFVKSVVHDLTLARAERRRVDLVLHAAGRGGPAIESKPADAPVQFSDTPNFTVAGITDRSNMGLHGSDTNRRTSDILAKETAALKSSSAQESAASGAGEAHRLAGDAKEKSSDPLGAVKEYEAAVKADPSEQNYFSWGAELLLHRAGQAAVQVFSAGAKAHPDSSRMVAALGAAYYANGQYTEASSQLCRASDLNPANPAPYLFLGKMEQAASDPFSCSETALSRFAANQPANAEANFFYGLVLWKKARQTQDAANLSRAELFFRKALESNPGFAEVYLQLGLLYNARGEKSSALAAFQKAVSADPPSSRAHYQLSLAYRRSGDAARADLEMKTYNELRRSEDAALEKERRELRQFVTILQEGKSAQR